MDYNDDTGRFETFECKEGETFKDFPDNVTRVDHHFLGWADSEGTVYSASSPVTVTENRTFYARWQDARPQILTSGLDPDGTYGSDLSFRIQAVDYKGNYFSSNDSSDAYRVVFDGEQIFSDGTDDEGTIYSRTGLEARDYTVDITVKDSEGNRNSLSVTITVTPEETPVPEEKVTLFIEAYTVYGSDGQVLDTDWIPVGENESAAHFVERVLPDYGYSAAFTGSGYLQRIYGGSLGSREIKIPGGLSDLYGEMTLKDRADPDSLGEMDLADQSGWIYLINDQYQGYGMGETILHDGDQIHIGFTLKLGQEYSGEGGGLYYGQW